MTAPLSPTIISQFHTVQHNSQTLSMEPSRLHVAGHNSPVFVSDSDNYLNMSNPYIDMHDVENERGEYINIKKWEPLNINRKTDSRGRIHVNEANIGKDIRIFVSDYDYELEMCKNYVLLPYPPFKEVVRTRGEEKKGDPLKVQSNGDVWTGSKNKNKFVKVFVKVEINDWNDCDNNKN